MTHLTRDYAKEDKEIGRAMLIASFVAATLTLIMVAFWVNVGMWAWHYFI